VEPLVASMSNATPCKYVV